MQRLRRDTLITARCKLQRVSARAARTASPHSTDLLPTGVPARNKQRMHAHGEAHTRAPRSRACAGPLMRQRREPDNIAEGLHLNESLHSEPLEGSAVSRAEAQAASSQSCYQTRMHRLFAAHACTAR